ncbi:MAG TPA: diguanylate cyclase [Malonomonas sp.]
MKAAIIVAEAAEERRAIAQFLKPTELFAQIHFCGTSEEVEFLLENSAVDIIFCDLYSQGQQALPLTATLVAAAGRYNLPLIFCSHLDPAELSQLGVIPAAAHCLNYESSPAAAAALLSQLLQDKTSARASATLRSVERLIDSSSGIYNRFYFDVILDQELSRSKLTGRPFSLLLIDAEQEQLSAFEGNWPKLFPSVALTVKEQIRTSDLLCRIEKKRLALLLPETSKPNAERVVDRIQSKLRELATEFPIALKFGLASPNRNNHFNRHGLLSEAEAAL